MIAYGPSVCGNGPDYAVRVSHYLDSIIDFVKDDECVSSHAWVDYALPDLPRGPDPRKIVPPASPPLPSERPPPTPVSLPAPPPPVTPTSTPPVATSSPVYDPTLTPDITTSLPTTTPAATTTPPATVTPATTSTPEATSTSAPIHAISTFPPGLDPVSSTPTPTSPVEPTSPPQPPTCSKNETACDDGQIASNECTCTWPLVVAIDLRSVAGPWTTVRTHTLRSRIADALGIAEPSRVQVEEILAQPQLGQAFASFLVLPTAPSSEWSPAQEQQARLLVLKALQVDPLGEGRADTHVSKLEIFGRQHGVSPPETLKRSTVAIWGSCLGAVAFFALLAAAAIVIRCRRASTPSRKNSGDSGMGVRLFASETPPPAAWQHEQAARKAGPRPQLLHMSMGSIGVPSGMFKEILGSKKGQGAWEELHSEASTPSAAPRDGMPAGSRDSGPLFLEPPETRLSDWVDSPSPLPSLRLPPLLVGSSGAAEDPHTPTSPGREIEEDHCSPISTFSESAAEGANLVYPVHDEGVVPPYLGTLSHSNTLVARALPSTSASQSADQQS